MHDEPREAKYRRRHWGSSVSVTSSAPVAKGAASSGNANPDEPASDFQLPIDYYSIDQSESDQLNLASQIKLGECVRAAGFTFNESGLPH